MISVFDMYKIGIGPSSSHTVGPMKAGKEFIDHLVQQQQLKQVTRLHIDVYGSLSMTGRGHNTDIAIILGLAGYLPDNVDIDHIPSSLIRLKTEAVSTGISTTRNCFRFLSGYAIPFHFSATTRKWDDNQCLSSR